MHRRAWLAYTAVAGLSFSATVLRPSQSEDSLATIPLTLISSGNLSAAKTNDSSLKNVPITNQLFLNNTAPLSSNFSISLLNLPFGYNLPAVTSGVPQCHGDVYGTDLDRHSCFDAWQNVGWTPERVSWGPRGTAHDFQYRLPYRWSSGEYSIKTWNPRCNDRLWLHADDGLCVIDVVIRQDSTSDFASFSEIKEAAEKLMRQCIDPLSSPAKGGFIGDVGM